MFTLVIAAAEHPFWCPTGNAQGRLVVFECRHILSSPIYPKYIGRAFGSPCAYFWGAVESGVAMMARVFAGSPFESDMATLIWVALAARRRSGRAGSVVLKLARFVPFPKAADRCAPIACMGSRYQDQAVPCQKRQSPDVPEGNHSRIICTDLGKQKVKLQSVNPVRLPLEYSPARPEEEDRKSGNHLLGVLFDGWSRRDRHCAHEGGTHMSAYRIGGMFFVRCCLWITSICDWRNRVRRATVRRLKCSLSPHTFGSFRNRHRRCLNPTNTFRSDIAAQLGMLLWPAFLAFRSKSKAASNVAVQVLASYIIVDLSFQKGRFANCHVS